MQEMIDICDFAVGLSRQLYGLTIATERPGHRMMETWHPLGVTGIISAFNFPVAVWAWNAALALVCGNAVVWKPSEKTPLTALAAQAILERALKRFGEAPEGLAHVLIGDRTVGEVLVDHPKVPLVSATGSTRMGREVGPRLAKRFARAILELGGNNGGIVCSSADLDMACLRTTMLSEPVFPRRSSRWICAKQSGFWPPMGSDCGIANVNIGTTGAEIGGAFGGEKETGGGRESGSDSWKAYMRRATNTVNYSKSLPLAQGVSFDIE
ncbi:hypothetical protein MPL3356_60020 [Mesorhizobium plurifarium]|uniref:Aldehyde dehydrogenase domain-containing protein n=1 Tax=Mesorhizobium plurifarium TaxID=69974 RepID=A0A090E7E1_MESPL|nr:hypothetical protein MPL3356_60020 [Mesorhizobium plurifarium]